MVDIKDIVACLGLVLLLGGLSLWHWQLGVAMAGLLLLAGVVLAEWRRSAQGKEGDGNNSKESEGKP